MTEIQEIRKLVLLIKGMISELTPEQQTSCFILVRSLHDQLDTVDLEVGLLALTLLATSLQLTTLEEGK